MAGAIDVRLIPMVMAVFAVVNLSACAAIGVAETVAGTGAGIAVSAISTTASVAGDVIGGAARTVTGSGSNPTPHDSQ
ncbi:MAG TPA: hypothetical protein VGM72_07380 [Micropepsaceae bacterium]|jgi:acetaldehyde dehydrogenase (acetylating)